MKILIVGNMGYVGSVVVRELAVLYPSAVLHGYDNAYFAHCLTGAGRLPESQLEQQFFGDARSISVEMLKGYTAVVQLAAVSNDPMGNRFSAVTIDINQHATFSIARAAQRAGVRNFVFASSCSIYGIASGPPRRESDALAPITVYAKSKIGAEKALATIDGDMVITSLRFATACGMSERLRLDLVLNDFVACALSQGRITVLSDGSPWRPLIDVTDMARAIDWAIQRKADNGGRQLCVNTGANERNHQVRDLASAVADAIPGTTVSINTDAPVDSRSYRVDFGLFSRLAPEHQPKTTLSQSIKGLIDGLKRMGFSDTNFRTSSLVRLHVLQAHVQQGRLSENLHWLSARRASSFSGGLGPKEITS
ncbi:SDR family oxidoreductase [Billgrantia tianxiuensis]|jgi:nucleoside-diphosphate-sugar epimerase|uniref:SDR family oxidoreductase n=1 Tax=Billgrantia tianxiuensis TaxID=2497861 RepID=A0A6I6SK44_9GAMM|nr:MULTISPECIES: SDR family oxidoreductase [Halomonas]MCE8034186.1 SDR family oxidoreductase [Halomonas sp. MCCC 1A11057]QHC50989.1 SDR family oxidoreductase [Halomonas tianxiuensis]